MTITKTALNGKYNSLKAHLDERTLRFCAAADARIIGYGGVSSVAQATGMSRTTIHTGLKELDEEVVVKKIRWAGAGPAILLIAGYRVTRYLLSGLRGGTVLNFKAYHPRADTIDCNCWSF